MVIGNDDDDYSDDYDDEDDYDDDNDEDDDDDDDESKKGYIRCICHGQSTCKSSSSRGTILALIYQS